MTRRWRRRRTPTAAPWLQVEFLPTATDEEIGTTLRIVGEVADGRPVLVTMRAAS